MPFDNAPFLQSDESDGPAARLVEAAVGKFKSNHPYLLFHRPAIRRIYRAVCNNNKLFRRLEACLARADSPDQSGKDTRTALKHQARRLINTSFMALISDGSVADQALKASRTSLSEFASATSWRRRPVIKSFLDCAEIAVAVSLAYDWLYDKLADGERRAVEEAIFRHMLEPGLASYQDTSVLWPKRRDNCAVVSNSGILIASLAVLGRYPNLSIQLIEHCLRSSVNSFNAFAPDGAWPEGLSYWSLAMRYAALMVAALESTLRTSFGLTNSPGFAETGDFVLHAAGPFGAAFNFGDSDCDFDLAPLTWLAHRFKRPVDGWLSRDYDGPHLALSAIWDDGSKVRPARLDLPRGKVFRGNGLACFRNTWSSADEARPVYLAIKGGNCSTTENASCTHPEDVMLHTQADAGSFIVDGAQRRWIIDLGPDDYDLPGYFDHGVDLKSGPRWHYYRTHAAGHNTLIINGLNQIPNAATPILGSCVEGDCKWVVFDLSAVYGMPAGAIRRGAALIGRRVIIQDEVDPVLSGNIVWVVHTSADPDWVAGSVARFRSGADRFVARILEPNAARFELTFPPPPRSFRITDPRKMHGRLLAGGGDWVSELPRLDDEQRRRAAGAMIKRLEITWPKGTRRLAVLLLPDSEADEDNEHRLPVIPLDHWLTNHPNRSTGYSDPLHGDLRVCNPTELSGGIAPLKSESREIIGTNQRKRF